MGVIAKLKDKSVANRDIEQMRLLQYSILIGYCEENKYMQIIFGYTPILIGGESQPIEIGGHRSRDRRGHRGA